MLEDILVDILVQEFTPRRVNLPDGLYEVTRSYMCAGFIVKDGLVTNCAPLLRRKLDYWTTQAVRTHP